MRIGFSVIVCALFFLTNQANGKKLDWSGGYFTLSSQTPTAKSSFGNMGAFQISTRFNLYDNLEFGFGYSLTFSKFFSGDYGYGPDMGLFYFPFTSAGDTNLKDSGIHILNHDIYRPFVCVQFHTRQFQSIGASYAGFSMGGGIEYWRFHPVGIRLWAKNTQLLGPQKSTATEFTVMGGFSWEY